MSEQSCCEDKGMKLFEVEALQEATKGSQDNQLLCKQYKSRGKQPPFLLLDFPICPEAKNKETIELFCSLHKVFQTALQQDQPVPGKDWAPRQNTLKATQGYKKKNMQSFERSILT